VEGGGGVAGAGCFGGGGFGILTMAKSMQSACKKSSRTFEFRKSTAMTANPLPLIKEFYRGSHIAGFGFSELNAARAAIDRQWARKICEAPDAAGRAAVLAEERQLRLASKPPPSRRRGAENSEDW
jgi:hypothetical protein